MVDEIKVLSKRSVPIFKKSELAIDFWGGVVLYASIDISLFVFIGDFSLFLYITAFGIILWSLLGIAIQTLTREQIGEYIEYKVTIDEEVSMVKFMEKYEIISVEGEIYTIKEKK